MSRLERVRENLRKAYDTGRDSVRTARAAEENGSEPDQEIEFELPPPEPQDQHQSTASRDDAEVPHSLRIAAAWSWRLIVVGVIGWALLRLVGIISIVVIPLSIALLLSALLAPAVGWLRRLNLRPSLNSTATSASIVGHSFTSSTRTLSRSAHNAGSPVLASV